MITLKEIAGYLAHDLQAEIRFVKFPDTQIRTVTPSILFQWHQGERTIKPLLYPLSMLTQEIEHNGEKIILSEYFNANAEKYYLPTDWDSVLFIGKENIKSIPFAVIEKFHEWHIDYQDLIGQGKAIDKTTLK